MIERMRTNITSATAWRRPQRTRGSHCAGLCRQGTETKMDIMARSGRAGATGTLTRAAYGQRRTQMETKAISGRSVTLGRSSEMEQYQEGCELEEEMLMRRFCSRCGC